MEQGPRNESEQTLRLTLRWVLAAVVLLFGVGILGGVVGQRLLIPPLPPLLTAQDRLVTTVQEVTISPNTSAAQVVATAGRSVVLIGTRTGTALQPRATAVVITNDGLLATTAALPETEIVAVDDRGAATTVDRVGNDELYGISYFRLPASVIVPLDVRRDGISVGTELLAISRSDVTRQTKVGPYAVHEFTLPREGDRAGLQRIMQGTPVSSSLFIGAPLVDEEGRLSGLLIDTTGRALEATAIEHSLQRLSAGQREFDPLAQLGLALQFSFVATPDGGAAAFTPRIMAVTPASPASKARLQRGDSLVSVNEEAISWEKGVVEQLSAAWPLTITVRRDQNLVTATVAQVIQAE